MKVEIWSDIMCPFCYIGKRKFELALGQFEHTQHVEVEWKAFQLSPGMKTDPNLNIHQFLARHKGISLEQAKRMNGQVTNIAKQVGLVYDFDKAIPANSFNAHRLSHFAKARGKQDEMEELLFKSYFTEGRNIDDIDTLVQLAALVGLDESEARASLEGDEYHDEVEQYIMEAQQIRVTGVPFFVFNRRYAISGAQDSKTFLEVLEKSFSEWQEQVK